VPIQNHLVGKNLLMSVFWFSITNIWRHGCQELGPLQSARNVKLISFRTTFYRYETWNHDCKITKMCLMALKTCLGHVHDVSNVWKRCPSALQHDMGFSMVVGLDSWHICKIKPCGFINFNVKSFMYCSPWCDILVHKIWWY
jgi:hypothetical protein